jgi:enamine deaminase RidA (YjgF/YER057c/UK114 family)
LSSSAGAGDVGSSSSSRGGITRLGGDPPSPWETANGFSRIVRAGDLVFVAGTTSTDVDGVIRGETPYEQTVEILRKFEHELPRVGAAIGDVVQTRIYVTQISRAEEVGRAHAEVFGDARPAMALVEVSALYDPRMLVEIEAVAVVGRAERL